jgi:hypothetical protein
MSNLALHCVHMDNWAVHITAWLCVSCRYVCLYDHAVQQLEAEVSKLTGTDEHPLWRL